MAGFQIIQKIKLFSLSFEIFRANYGELRKLLVFHSQEQHALELWKLRNRHLLEAFQKEVARLLHNFVASALSLVDHTRVHYRDLYEADGRFPEYKAEVKKRFQTNPLASFVRGLRQFCLHYKIPSIQSEMRYSREPPILESRLQLIRGNLEEFSAWTSPAKRFLARQEDSIDLLNVMDDYYSLVASFYRWFSDRQRELHSDELDEVYAKERELAAIDIPRRLRTGLVAVNAGSTVPDEVFAGILTPQEWEQLENCPANTPERCETLIGFVERRAPLSEDLKRQIRRMYGMND